MNKNALTAWVAATILSFQSLGAVDRPASAAPAPQLWRYPADIASRNLFYGAGGKEHQPHGEFVFLEEDRSGSSPKFMIRGLDGVKWKVKLGLESQPETVATRLAWAVGYFTDEDYLVPRLRVLEMPARLHRGRKLVTPDGWMLNARLERHIDGEKKLGTWSWRDNPFSGARELNGLRVVMALLNNWDVKDINNAIYTSTDKGGKQVYVVADLGAGFGAPGFAFPTTKAKNNLQTYSHSKFITRATADYVDFSSPARPAIVRWVDPPDFIRRLKLRWLGRRIPRRDARWMGQLLARLSRRQISDAFRAGGYSPAEIEAYTAIVQSRIAELSEL